MDMGAGNNSPYIGDDGYNTTISRPYLPIVVVHTGEKVCIKLSTGTLLHFLEVRYVLRFPLENLT